MQTNLNQQIQLKPWAKLIAKGKGLADQTLKCSIITIGRKNNNIIIINQPRLSGQHCIIIKKDGKVYLEDKSSNGTFLNNIKMTKGSILEIQNGDEIWLLHPTKVSPEIALGYKILFQQDKQKEQQLKQQINIQKIQQLKRQEQEQKQKQIIKRTNQEVQKRVQQEQKKINEQKKKIQSQLKNMVDQITCCICLEIMFLPVTVHPCNHRFCGSCLTGLIKSKQQNCAQCRNQITTAQRDSSFTSLIQEYLKNHPDQIKSKQQQQLMIKTNMFNHDTIDVYQFIHGKKKNQVIVPPPPPLPIIFPPIQIPKRGRRRLDQIPIIKCDQCLVPRNGFRCIPTQIHVGCITCAKLIARRNDPMLNQCCVLCDQYFCNLYLPPCHAGGIKLIQIKNRQNIIKFDQQIFRGNQFEFITLKNYLLEKKMNSQDLFKNILINYLDKNVFKYIVDRKIMKIPPIMNRQIPVTRQSAVCDICWNDLWFQMVFTFRINIVKQLPGYINSRGDCYYGMNCKTMVHNKQHAKKLNHCCFQTKF